MRHPISIRPAARLAAVMLCSLLIVAAAGCGNPGATSSQAEQAAASRPAEPTRKIDFKIGLMTGTVSQGEDEFRAGEMIVAKYGADHVKHVTYPDNFMQEQETVIGQLVGLAADPDVKVIIMGQAVPGAIPALRKIREKRPDIKIVLIEPHEDPAIVNAEADLVLQPDQLARGRTILGVAKTMGVTDFVHYSFPRHMSQELLTRRRDIMKAAAAENGIRFHFVTAPDPMGEGTLAASQQFILEDVPREIKKLGPKTAFFSTNCGMQDPLIRAVLTSGGYVPEQCCPSPTHGYPTALGIAIPPDKAGDMAYINAENKRVITEHNRNGHFATWPIPEVMLALRTATDLMVDAVEGKADYADPATVNRYLADRAGVPITLSKYDDKKGNSYLLLVDSIYY